MKKSKSWSRSNAKALGLLVLVLGIPATGRGASASSDGTFVMSKDLVGPSGGVVLQGGVYAMNFTWGEAASGQTLAQASRIIESGYYGGRFGAGQGFGVSKFQVSGAPAYFQNGLQIGVTVQASVQITFSDQLDSSTIAAGVTATLVRDNMANPQSRSVPVQWSYDPAGRTLIVGPQTSWQGNSLYDIAVNANLRSVNAYSLSGAAHVEFLTMADPRQQNVIVNSASPGGASALALGGVPSLRVEVPPGALSDYSVILFNPSPLQSPWKVDPAAIQDATRKAQASGGPYQTPAGLVEIAAYNPQGQALGALAQPAHISVSYGSSAGWLTGAPAPVHTSTLALWALDQDHHLWVKIPASVADGRQVTAPVTRFTVFALMGSPLGSASDAFVFPIPWRPHGSNAGNGSGQTGTEQGGMTFSNLPSECTIRIFTISGGLVRELRHSDTAGPVAQERWDGNTSGGAHAASGVYLWRVESAQDGKNGKLMIIR